MPADQSWRAYGEFLGAFRIAAEKLREGVRDVVFPAGSFPPCLLAKVPAGQGASRTGT